jgi:glycosyltransferase involved in cell wall biosynthesis
MPLYVVPSVSSVAGYLRPGDIIYVRGGFRSWFSLLDRVQNDHWILFYGAATQRWRWLFWDVVFDDLNDTTYLDSKERLHLAFQKPTNPDLFRPIEKDKRYDICIGASHIHDKKGQWRTVNALVEYRRRFLRDLDCIMPGRFFKGEHTNQIPKVIEDNELDRIEFPGMLQRTDMAEVYSRCKLYVHLATAGQNDRGPLEAMRCGTPSMIGFPRYHPPVLGKTPGISETAKNPDDPVQTAIDIHEMLNRLATKEEVFKFHEEKMGIESVILPFMDRLFSFLRRSPNKDRPSLWKEYLSC